MVVRCHLLRLSYLEKVSVRNEFIPDFTKIRKQSDAWNALSEKEVQELLFGGAKGGGKSVFGCLWSYIMAYSIAQKYFPQRPDYPITIGFMGRKVAKDFSNTTLNTWKRFIPANRYMLKDKPPKIIIHNRVAIQTGGLDRSEDIQQFNSAELAFFFIDQAEEVTIDDVSALRASLRLKLNNEELDYKGLFTANPRQCWLKNEFILNPSKHRRFIQSLPGENPLLPSSYIPRLKDTFKHRPELLQAYLYGDWSALEGPDNLIKDIWLEQAGKLTFHYHKPRHLLACDVARFGDDETVIFHLEETQIVWEDTLVFSKKPTTYTASMLQKLSYRLGGVPIIVDEEGVGGGVVDTLADMGEEVHGIISGSKSDEPERYYNVRAEMWDKASRMFSDQEIQLHKPEPQYLDDYNLLRNQLCIPRYKFRGARLLVNEKAEIKSELGRSPDRADAYILGLYGLRWARRPQEEIQEEKPDKWSRKRQLSSVWSE